MSQKKKFKLMPFLLSGVIAVTITSCAKKHQEPEKLPAIVIEEPISKKQVEYQYVFDFSNIETKNEELSDIISYRKSANQSKTFASVESEEYHGYSELNGETSAWFNKVQQFLIPEEYLELYDWSSWYNGILNSRETCDRTTTIKKLKLYSDVAEVYLVHNEIYFKKTPHTKPGTPMLINVKPIKAGDQFFSNTLIYNGEIVAFNQYGACIDTYNVIGNLSEAIYSIDVLGYNESVEMTYNDLSEIITDINNPYTLKK